MRATKGEAARPDAVARALERKGENMPVRYRVATTKDAPAIADLHARSWRATYRGSYRDDYLDGGVHEDRLTVWTSRLNDPPPNQFVVVAEDDDTIVGFACAYGGHDAQWGSFLDNIHADPDRHREGTGTGLVAAVVDWCRERFPEHGLHLSVLERNTNARRFYARLGAVDHGGAPSSSEWMVGEVEVRLYAWDTLDAVRASDNNSIRPR
jgi:GNAT superfamily N-acetyltransferase